MSAGQVTLRPVRARDAALLARLYADERAFLAPFEPTRSEAFFTEEGQRKQIEHVVSLRGVGAAERFLICEDGEPAGIMGVSNIVLGAFRSATIGYFVAQARNGRGIATRAIGLTVEWAFEEVELHRLEAGTLVDNIGSQKALERNGFERIGIARRYLHIGGDWRDHVLFQRLVDPVETRV